MVFDALFVAGFGWGVVGGILILPRFFGLDGIWWAITVAEVCACVVSGSFLFAKWKQYHYA
jgi:Na+-driven multidrug efflux pump